MTDASMPIPGESGGAPLHVSARRIGEDVILVAVGGEIDSATAPQVTTYLRRVTSQGPAVVALDLSDVTFLASSGVKMLITALNDDQGVHGALHLIAPSPAVQRVLTLVGVDQMFNSHTTIDELMHALHTDPGPTRTTTPVDEPADPD